MNCKLCESSNITKVNWGSTGLIYCFDCDIHYLEEFPVNENLENYYKNEYTIKNEAGYTEFRRISRLNEQYELINIISKYKSINSVLDIGCDKGYFLDEARRLGIKVAGVELSENARQYCNLVGLDVRSSIHDFDTKFDAIIMNHSLEHFPSPNEILTDINSQLNDNGLLIVRVPAFDSIWSRLMKHHWIWFQPKNHYFHFSIKSLMNLVQKHGFNVKLAKHRKPNNSITKRLTSVARTSMMNNNSYQPTLRNRIGYIVESIVGVEVFLIAEKSRK